MAYEIEVKAWAEDPEAVRLRLQSLCGSGRSFLKKDEYFALAGAGQTEESFTLFRLRSDGASSYVTRKSRVLQDGVEENRELEFKVDDPDVFRQFALDLGYVPSITKTKRGEQYSFRRSGFLFETLVELSEVVGVGNFVEIEVVLPEGADRESRDSARAAVRNTLADLEIAESAIETRRYTQMLMERSL